MMKLIALLLVIAAVVLGIALSVANPQIVQLDLLVTQIEWKLLWILAAELVFVVLVSYVLFSLRLSWLKRKIRRLEKQVEARDSELSAMRNLPVTQG